MNLVIVVDQMRTPQWFPEPQKLHALLPNIGRLQRSSASFESHYTASNMCTPSRRERDCGADLECGLR
jgi:arylsulfatase A-like enzyme